MCLRPVSGLKDYSPVKHPELVDMVIFRENTEDVYAGLELKEGSSEANELADFCERRFGWAIRRDSGLGLKPISRTGTERLMRAAIDYAIRNGRKSVTLVHKGNIQKFTEGAFRSWGYELAKRSSATTWLRGRNAVGRFPRARFSSKRRHRGHLSPAGSDEAGGIRCDCNDKPQR